MSNYSENSCPCLRSYWVPFQLEVEVADLPPFNLLNSKIRIPHFFLLHEVNFWSKKFTYTLKLFPLDFEVMHLTLLPILWFNE